MTPGILSSSLCPFWSSVPVSESKQSLTDGTPASDSIDEKVFDDVSPDDFLEKPQNEFTVEIGEATGSIEDLCPGLLIQEGLYQYLVRIP